MTLHTLAIPMRRRVSHAAAQRAVSEPIVVEIELQDGSVGFGETHPRPYVTGETHKSVRSALQSDFIDSLLAFNPPSFAHALELIDQLPWHNDQGAAFPAARAAVELALLDAYSRCYRRPIDDIEGWVGSVAVPDRASRRPPRFSGVLTADTAQGCRRQLRMMRWYGLSEFKLKVGMPDDDRRMAAIARPLRGRIARGRGSLRLDANGAWALDEAVDHLNRWKDIPIDSIEQPLSKGREDELQTLSANVEVPLMHDESLVQMDDAVRLYELGVADGFNIRISKCGGLLPSIRLAHFAHKIGATIQLGCMVGETGILSAAALTFLRLVPGIRWCEGCFGTLLLRSDVTGHSPRFRYGGRIPRYRGAEGCGLGISVDRQRLAAFALLDPVTINL